MRTAFSLHKSRKYIFILFLFFLGSIFHVFSKNNTPPRFQNLLTGHFKLYLIHFSHHGSSRNLTIGIEHRNKTTGYQIINTTLHIRQILRINACRDNCMVICYLRIIEYFFRFRQWSTCQRSCQHFIIPKAFQYSGTLGIDIVTQKSGIDTRISGYFLFIKGLNQFQRFVGRVSKLLITLYLKGSQVEQTRSVLLSIFLTDAGDNKRKILDTFYQGFSLLPIGNRINAGIVYLLLSTVLFFFGSYFFIAFPDESRKSRIPIIRFQFPVLFRLEVSNFQLTIDNQCQCRGLYTTDGKYLFILTVFNCVKTGRIHPQQPVPHCTGKSGFVQRLEIRLVFQLGKSFTNGFFGQWRNPQTFHRTAGTCLLHHPTLNQFPFLPGITAVDNLICMLHQSFDNVELFFVSRVINQLDTETWRNHR